MDGSDPLEARLCRAELQDRTPLIRSGAVRVRQPHLSDCRLIRCADFAPKMCPLFVVTSQGGVNTVVVVRRVASRLDVRALSTALCGLQQHQKVQDPRA